jgi:hypothetical protein
MGMLHNKSAVIELPAQLEYLRTNATELGEPLEILLQRINQEQLTTGRVGLLADMPKTPDPLNPEPFIALYVAEAIRNWDVTPVNDERAELNLVILDESRFEMDDNFNWKTLYKYRVLRMQKEFSESGDRLLSSTYLCGSFSSLGAVPGFDPTMMFTPTLRGVEQPSLPFVFVNSKDITADPDEPPLNGLARLCAAIYRGEADYRQNLFMQGQDTLVIIGNRAVPLDTDPVKEEPLRTGAGSRIELEIGGDAKYVGVQSQGLIEQRYALENDRKRAESRSGQLIDAAKGAKESGTALRTRVGAQTATLNQIAKTGALALELILKKIAFWKGADPEEVKVTPNLEFADYQMSGQDLVNLMTAKRTGGAPLSLESIHRLMVQGNLTGFDFVTEQAMLSGEEEFETPEAKLARELAEKNNALDTNESVSNPGPAPADPANPAQID